MANLGVVMRAEIMRLAGQVGRGIIKSIHKDVVRLKHDVASHKRRMKVLESIVRVLKAESDERVRSENAVATPEEVSKARIGVLVIKATRKRLGLSQAQFARLVGVNTITISKWETCKNKLSLREKTRAAVVAVRKLRARDAKRKLALLDKVAVKGRKRKGGKSSR